jgi:hypothetical protein
LEDALQSAKVKAGGFAIGELFNGLAEGLSKLWR